MSDNLTPEQRSYCMSQIKGKDTGIELCVRSALHKRGLRFKKNVRTLPGKPDIVFTRKQIAVFIDGDFWHGFRFPCWKHKVNQSWQEKIEKTRKRDRINMNKLRSMGWEVIRIWEHDIKNKPMECISRICKAVESR